MSELKSTLEFLQTEVARLADAVDRIDHQAIARSHAFWKDQEADNRDTLARQPKHIQDVMGRVDVYADLRAGPYARTTFDSARRDLIVKELNRVIADAVETERHRCADICWAEERKYMKRPDKDTPWVNERGVGAADCARKILGTLSNG